MTILLASCVFVENDSKQILAVARKKDATKFGLPGGKVESHETTLAAAIRELKEETGLNLQHLKILYSNWVENYFVITYWAKVGNGLKLSPGPGEPEAKWVDRKILLEGPFGKYNRNVFLKYDTMMGLKNV